MDEARSHMEMRTNDFRTFLESETCATRSSKQGKHTPRSKMDKLCAVHAEEVRNLFQTHLSRRVIWDPIRDEDRA